MTDTTHGDGEWTMRIHNDRWNDIKVHQFRIVLEVRSKPKFQRKAPLGGSVEFK